jgi:hypothetical protein
MILPGDKRSAKRKTCLSTTPTVSALTGTGDRTTASMWYGILKLLPLCTQVKIFVLLVGHYFHNNFDIHNYIITKYSTG